MTQSIDHGASGSAKTRSQSEADTTRRPGVVTAARWFFAVMTATALGFLAATFAGAGWRAGLAAATFTVLALIGGLVIAIDMLLSRRLAACREYYFAGQLDGWMRGWNGQPPEVAEPRL